MPRDSASSREPKEVRKVREVRDDEEKLVAALQLLFALLEGYAPTWYTEQHHNVASSALTSCAKIHHPPIL